MRPERAPDPPAELTTTRAANGAMTTTTPDMRPRGDGGMGRMMRMIMERRRQAPRKVAAPAPPPQQGARMMAPAPTPEYRPQLASAPMKPARVTRDRKIRNPLQPFWNFGGSLPDNQVVQEYQLPDGSWSLDAVHGPIGGKG